MNTLKNTLGKKVNLHSQHDLFYLLDAKYHLNLLDKFGNADLESTKTNYEKIYKKVLFYDKSRIFLSFFFDMGSVFSGDGARGSGRL